MFSEEEFINEEKDCAKMLGMSLEEYREYIRNSKIPAKITNKCRKYDNKILDKLGLTSKDLKKRKVS